MQRDWSLLRADLNRLASYYSLTFNLDNQRNMPMLPATGVMTNPDARFTGTYRLNLAQSDDARAVAERRLGNHNYRERDRVYAR